jgi:hypothetical protein
VNTFWPENKWRYCGTVEIRTSWQETKKVQIRLPTTSKKNEQQHDEKRMLYFRPTGRRRTGRPLKRLLDEAETVLSVPNSWRIIMTMVMMYYIFYLQFVCLFVCLFWSNISDWVRASSFTSFLHQTQRRTTVRRTPLDEWSACRRDLYLKSHNTHNRQTSMPPVEFEPTISAGERPQTYALEWAATGTCNYSLKNNKNCGPLD